MRWNDEGASMIEYALLVVLIAIVAIVALAYLGEGVAQLFSEVGDSIPGGGAPGTTGG